MSACVLPSDFRHALRGVHSVDALQRGPIRRARNPQRAEHRHVNLHCEHKQPGRCSERVLPLGLHGHGNDLLQQSRGRSDDAQKHSDHNHVSEFTLQLPNQLQDHLRLPCRSGQHQQHRWRRVRSGQHQQHRWRRVRSSQHQQHRWRRVRGRVRAMHHGACMLLVHRRPPRYVHWREQQWPVSVLSPRHS